jgi:hypothetical protein
MRPEKNQHDCVIPRLAAAIKVADRETELSPHSGERIGRAHGL